MKDLQVRLRKRYYMTIKNWKNDCTFSKKLAWLRLVDEIGGRIGLSKLSAWAHGEKEKWILSYLQDMLEPVILEYQHKQEEGIYQENVPIWCCWWTGEEDAPQLVQQCLKTIRKNAGKHPVNLISKNNYYRYLDIPQYILIKVQKGEIGLAHLADYLRICLLERC